MHSECIIWMQISQIFPGETPGHPPAGGGNPSPTPPPFGAMRLSEAFGFIGHLAPPPAVEVLDPPLYFPLFISCHC